MGTRSNTIIIEDGFQLVNMYRQMDGYLDGHGADLLEFLEPITLVNGFGQRTAGIANGAGCLAAQLIAHFKEGVGNIYLQAITQPEIEHENDFTYTILVEDMGIALEVHEYGALIFEGTVEEFKQRIAQEKAA